MVPDITFFPVGNGDMTLIRLSSGRTILIDCNIRQPGDGVRDVLADLIGMLPKDEKKRPYVDVMVLSHPDEDHCRGFETHFHLGPLGDYSKTETKKIVVREMWSSPLIFRRASSEHPLSSDAKAWNKEAKRRVNLFKDKGFGAYGDKILMLSKDPRRDMKGLDAIIVKADQAITSVAGHPEANFSALLLAPIPTDNEKEIEILTKNGSSVIMNYSIGTGNVPDAVKLLSGGDADVAIWEKQWGRNGKKKVLEYDILQTPHHCSWHTLSGESWSKTEGKAKASPDARSALAQARGGAFIVASCNEIKNDYNDPPCIGAKREYEAIATAVKGTFLNTETHPKAGAPEPMTFEVKSEGPLPTWKKAASTPRAAAALPAIATKPLSHGS